MIAVIRYGEEFPQVVFEIEPSADWQILDGTSRFVGKVEKGQKQELRFRAVPLSDTPEALRGVVRIPGRPLRMAALDPGRLGGHYFENGRRGTAHSESGGACGRRIPA